MIEIAADATFTFYDKENDCEFPEDAEFAYLEGETLLLEPN